MDRSITIGLEKGLHAKTAAAFVHEASQYKAEIHLKKGSSLINAKSILGLMSIVLQKDDDVTLSAEGSDAEEALAGLAAFLEKETL